MGGGRVVCGGGVVSGNVGGVGWSVAAGWSAVAGWIAARRAQWAAMGWSVVAGSSTAAAEGWAAERPAAEYRLGSFEKSERERERNFDSYWVGQFQAQHSLDTKVPDWALGVGKGGGRGWGLPPPLPTSQGARLGTWGGEGRGEGEGSAPPLPTSQGA